MRAVVAGAAGEELCPVSTALTFRMTTLFLAKVK
jgi:hypothetical protein